MTSRVYLKAATPLPPYPIGPPPPVSAPALFQTSAAPASGYTMLVSSQPPPQAQEQVPKGDQVQYGRLPRRVQCQHCGTHVITSIQRRVGSYAWLMGCFVCLLGGFLGCCLIPCLTDSCKDVIHTCPVCENVVGLYRRNKGGRHNKTTPS